MARDGTASRWPANEALYAVVLAVAAIMFGSSIRDTMSADWLPFFARSDLPTWCAPPTYESGRGAKVLVTGGAGFIGSHIANYAAKELGMQVVVVDDLSGGFERNVDASLVTFVRGDLRDPAVVADLWARHGPFQYVYHSAAYAAEGLSHFIRRYNYETNLLASMNLINAAVNGNASVFVFLSSIAVYGTGVTPLLETAAPRPEDPYGVSKYAVELDLKAAHEMFGLNYVIFRPHNVYGPGQNIADKHRNVIGIFMRQILEGQPLTIFGDGAQTRAFSYIDDVAPYIAKAPLLKAAYNQVFNVGSDGVASVNELAAAVSKAMGQNGAHTRQYLPARNEVKDAHSDHTKLRCFFKPEVPEVPLETGLARMAAWAREVHAKGSASGGEGGSGFTPTPPPVDISRVEVRKNMPPSWLEDMERAAAGAGAGRREEQQ